jgi:hypothetical protein
MQPPKVLRVKKSSGMPIPPWIPLLRDKKATGGEPGVRVELVLPYQLEGDGRLGQGGL